MSFHFKIILAAWAGTALAVVPTPLSERAKVPCETSVSIQSLSHSQYSGSIELVRLQNLPKHLHGLQWWCLPSRLLSWSGQHPMLYRDPNWVRNTSDYRDMNSCRTNLIQPIRFGTAKGIPIFALNILENRYNYYETNYNIYVTERHWMYLYCAT